MSSAAPRHTAHVQWQQLVVQPYAAQQRHFLEPMQSQMPEINLKALQNDAFAEDSTPT